MLPDEIDVLHKYGMERHYSPIKDLSVEFGFNLRFYEYTFFNGREINIFSSSARLPALKDDVLENLSFLFLSSVQSDTFPIIVGAEPFDIRLCYIYPALKNRNIIYHTSWPDFSSPPHNVGKLVELLWHRFLSRADIVTVTKTSKRSIENLGYSAEYIPHGVDCDMYRPLPIAESNQFTILFVGRFVHEKGIKILLDFAKTANMSDFKIKFVGEGPLSDDISQMEEEYPVENCGYIQDDSELARIYNKSDVLVLPSIISQKTGWQELFGIVLIEAMACGTPVIATSHTGPSEIISHRENGFLLEEPNVDELYEYIAMLKNNKSLADSLGKEGRKAVLNKYSSDSVSKKWKQALEQK
ncbi:glycosyltransferase family 4 protein [Halorubrum sp. AJ67]|uniref:glycosyltransferase family 4 protein n=1 Tax=Halorubrum sp. AJ67 TaxID=1173487 RepID=UPI0003DC87CB|nr:glycosyltransferase family 4 protein [Halorubrum sp. AJ67]CDK39338.1 glycosyl transferases group 1 family protein [Halorubrum sp. AJ67]